MSRKHNLQIENKSQLFEKLSFYKHGSRFGNHIDIRLLEIKNIGLGFTIGDVFSKIRSIIALCVTTGHYKIEIIVPIRSNRGLVG